MRAIETYILDHIEGRRTGLLMRSLLRLCSWGYALLIRLRHLAYDCGLMRRFRCSIPVVSVGNIACGGVGKTPLVKKLAEELAEHRRVAILTRGFRSQIERRGGCLRWQGEDALLCGDEPVWLARQLPQVAVWIGRRRSDSAVQAARAGADLLILDDGMQHRQLERQSEIVVMDARDPWRGGLLPRGGLRDLPSRLQVARLVVATGVRSSGDLAQLRAEIAPYTRAPLVGMRMRLQGDLSGRRVGLFCAIAKPERFVESVRAMGAEVVAQLFAPDHAPFTPEQIERFAAESERRGAERLVCTEKDGVKLPAGLKSLLPIDPLPAELEVVEGEEAWKDLIEELAHDRRV